MRRADAWANLDREEIARLREELERYRKALRGEDIYANTLVSLLAHSMPTEGQKIMQALGVSLGLSIS